MPSVPMVMVGEPLMMMLPPVDVPAAVFLPAFKITASADVLVVLMDCASVKLPDSVSTRTVPVLVMPVGLTVPMVNAPLLMTFTLPSLVVLLPPANVVMLLLVLVSVKLPVPFKPKPAAEIAADCVTLPVANRLTLLVVAVNAPLIRRSPPYKLTDPAMLVVELMVMLASLVPSAAVALLPIVRPVRVESNVQPLVEKADVKSLPADSMRKAPVPANVLLVGLGASCCSTRVPALMVVVPL